HAWDITTELLRSSFRWQIVVGLLFVLAAWLSGPRRYAAASRQLIAPLLHERVYPYVAVAVIALVLLVTGPAPDFPRLLFVVVLVALLVAGVEIMRRQTLREFPAGAGAISLGEARAQVTEWLEARRRQPSSPARTG